MPYATMREQWPVSLRLEDLEDGLFELPASGFFVVRDDYVVAASNVRADSVVSRAASQC